MTIFSSKKRSKLNMRKTKKTNTAKKTNKKTKSRKKQENKYISMMGGVNPAAK